MRTQEAATHLINSHLLILQSKRLTLNSAQRRLQHAPGNQAMKTRVDRLRGEASRAEHAYHAMVLTYGSPQTSDYWLVAYTKLMKTGDALITKLRDGMAYLPTIERFDATADIEALESIVERWGDSKLEAMVRAAS